MTDEQHNYTVTTISIKISIQVLVIENEQFI